MLNLEAEVAKVQLGASKAAAAAVATLAEPAGAASDVEIFGVCELPLLNPAATDDFDRLSEVVFASLRRSFRQQKGRHTFENSLSEINTVLQSQDYYNSSLLEQLNACVAVRDGQNFYVSAGGKISILLLRNREWLGVVDMDAPKQKKTDKLFASFSSGKLQVGDCLVLATSELLNYISLDRLKSIISGKVWISAGQELAKSLEDVAGPGIALGVLLIRFIDQDSVSEMPTPSPVSPRALTQSLNLDGGFKSRLLSISALVLNYIRSFLNNISRVFSTSILSKFHPGNVSLLSMAKKTSRVVASKTLKGGGKAFLNSSKRLGGWWQLASLKNKLSALLVIFILVGGGVGFWWNSNRNSQKQASLAVEIENINALENKLSEASSRHIYGDDDLAREILSGVLNSLKDFSGVNDSTQKSRLSTIQEQANILENKLNKIIPSEVYQVATLPKSEHLLVLPQNLATLLNGVLVKYNLSTSAVTEQNSDFKQSVLGSVVVDSSGKSILYDGDSLSVWQNGERTLGQALFQQVPKSADFGGMAFYSLKNRLYVADNALKQIVAFELSGSELTNPSVWGKTPLPFPTADIAIDGNVYVLSGGVHKFFQGSEAPAFFSKTSTLGLNSAKRIIATPESPTLFVLDSDNERIVLLNKDGGLNGILKNSDLKNADDFWVSFPNNIIYFVADGTLYKLSWQMSK